MREIVYFLFMFAVIQTCSKNRPLKREYALELDRDDWRTALWRQRAQVMELDPKAAHSCYMVLPRFRHWAALHTNSCCAALAGHC